MSGFSKFKIFLRIVGWRHCLLKDDLQLYCGLLSRPSCHTRRMEPKEPTNTGVELLCSVQTYHWGKRGSTSEVAKLAYANSKMTIDESQPYAELWMGTHPNGPSTVVGGFGQTLSEWIKEQPSSKAGADSLPFLLKVLSVNKPLSIQAHPTKSHAVELNKQDADTYKDPNHKPELSVALSPFEALLGFRPVDQLKLFFKTVPELSEVIGEEAVGEFSKSEGDATDPLKTCFNNLMTAEQKKVETALHKLLKRLNLADEETRKVQLAELVERLHEGYPGDVGVFGPYLFNYIQMRPGEAIYIPPNEPHAYLSGDCMECMACSDNVVRAGLTPKPKDVPTLVNMLTYLCESAESKIFSPENEDDYTVVFRPPVEDFALARINLPLGVGEYSLRVREAPSILLVLKGKANSGTRCLQRGTVLYIPAGEELKVYPTEAVTMYQGFQNS